MDQPRRMRARWWWLLCAASLLALAAAIALTVVSFFGQIRAFTPYGPSLAVDQGVLVIELEHPNRRGYRVVGSDAETQRRYLGGRAVIAWNTSPQSDSMLRTLATRHWLPRMGMTTFKGRSKAHWLGLPLWIPIPLVACGASRAFRAAMRRSRVGMCEFCAYPLHGLAPGAPCPECGRVTPRAA